MSALVVFVTTPSEQEAASLGKLLVEHRVAACVSIVPRIRSLFWWEDRITEEQECLMIIKSRTEVYSALERLVKSYHSYEVPEVLALPVEAGLEKYLTWLCEMTSNMCTYESLEEKSRAPERKETH
ncbi:MAG: divalent-cation tolerance protein CutA [Nitrospirae bacterium]|nr:MAG: divalent-cation tolerance protein CutA [Nitrospirota bacterium]